MSITNAAEARAITNSVNVDPFINHILERIQKAAELGKTRINSPLYFPACLTNNQELGSVKEKMIEKIVVDKGFTWIEHHGLHGNPVEVGYVSVDW